MGEKSVLRVGVMTDFRYSRKEIDEVLKWQDAGWLPFVNSNAHTRIAEMPEGVPVFVTVNPDVHTFVEPKGPGVAAIKAARFKWMSSRRTDVMDAWRQACVWSTAVNVPLLITPMRFRRKETAEALDWKPEHYEFKGGWYRLRPEHWPEVIGSGFALCDKSGKGCPACGNCAKLSHGVEATVWGIDLKVSGHCKYNCPDCWAKCTMQRTQGKIAWDKPKRNTKQRGKA